MTGTGLEVTRVPGTDFLKIGKARSEIDSTARVSAMADIELSILGNFLSVGANTLIDSFVKIKFVGGTGNISIGANCAINSGCVLYSGNGIRIADNVAIAANCTLAPTNHEYKSRDLIRSQGFRPSKGGIVIEEDVWIGANSVILDGAILRKGCVIGAGSVVMHEIAAHTVNAGHPLKVIRIRD